MMSTDENEVNIQKLYVVSSKITSTNILTNRNMNINDSSPFLVDNRFFSIPSKFLNLKETKENNNKIENLSTELPQFKIQGKVK